MEQRKTEREFSMGRREGSKHSMLTKKEAFYVASKLVRSDSRIRRRVR